MLLSIFEIIKTALTFFSGFLQKRRQISWEKKEETQKAPDPIRKGTVLKPKIAFTIYHPGSNKVVGKYKDRPGKVEFVSGNFKIDLGFWNKMRNFSNKRHYSKKHDTPTKVDLGSWHSLHKTWWGPAVDFKIRHISIGNYYHGSQLVIICHDGSKSEILCVHLVQINHDLLKGLTQSKQGQVVTFSGKGAMIPAGTYLGRTNGIIGCMSAPHFHMELKKGGTHRRHLHAILKG